MRPPLAAAAATVRGELHSRSFRAIAEYRTVEDRVVVDLVTLLAGMVVRDPIKLLSIVGVHIIKPWITALLLTYAL